MDSASFDNSYSNGFQSFVVSFATPIVNQITDVLLRFAPTAVVPARSTIELMFPTGFQAAAVTQSPFSLLGTSASFFNRTVLISASNGQVVARLAVSRSLAAGQQVYLTIPAATVALRIPAMGVPLVSAGLTVRLNTTLPNSTTIASSVSGAPQQVTAVGFFQLKQVFIQTPIPGQLTDVQLTFQLSQRILRGESIRLAVPGFLYKGNGSMSLTPNGIPLTLEIGADWMQAVFNSSSNTVVLTAIREIDAGITTVVRVDQSMGLAAPAGGIASPAPQFTVSSGAVNCPVQSISVDSITVVPVVTLPSLQFIGASADRAYEASGDKYKMRLVSGHELTAEDIGSRVKIQGRFYTITGLQGDIISILEPFTGIPVLLGLPVSRLYSPDVRPSYYISGSGTTTLTFRYTVQRGDSMSSIAEAIPTPINFIPSTLDVAIPGSYIYRFSMNPQLPASYSIPTTMVANAVTIDTTIPFVVNITTSTTTGVYAVGDQIDFLVRFNVPVAIAMPQSRYPVQPSSPYYQYTNSTTRQLNSRGDLVGIPELVLHVTPNTPVKALYSNGSGTNTLRFVYNVTATDLAMNNGKVFISTNNADGTYNPLRALRNGEFGFLRRYSQHPVLDVNTAVSVSVAANRIPSSISLYGSAARVVSISVALNSRGTLIFNAGDVMSINVKFSKTVSVTVGATSPDLWLDVGRPPAIGYSLGTPGQAIYTSMVDATVLQFKYTVTAADNITMRSPLYLHCDCQDTFGRTFVHLYDSSITDTLLGTRASVILAKDSSPSSRYISAIIIDNSTPVVTSVTSNMTSGRFSPGSVFKISVNYDQAVYVTGVIRLLMRGQKSSCIARYDSGSTSRSLNFVYVTSTYSGTSRLECDSVRALDVSLGGNVYKYSLNPTISASLTLVDLGTFRSLGFKYKVNVDPSLISVRNVGTSNYPIVPTTACPVAALTTDTFLMYSTYRQEDTAQQIKCNSSATAIASAVRSYVSNGPFSSRSSTFTGTYASGKYLSYVLADDSFLPLSFLPNIDTISSGLLPVSATNKQWWNANMSMQSRFNIEVDFDRNVQGENSYLLVNTHPNSLNRAPASNTGRKWFVTLYTTLPGFSNLMHYQLQYNGQLSTCIGVNTGTTGVHSLLAAINGMSLLGRLGPQVDRLPDTQFTRTYEIQFLSSLSAPITLYTGGGHFCDNPILPSLITIDQGSRVTYSYPIRSTSSILLTAKTSVPAGFYKVSLGQNNGITVSRWGLPLNTVKLEHLTPSGKLISQKRLPSTGILSASYRYVCMSL